jgi:hypothetical protein
LLPRCQRDTRCHHHKLVQLPPLNSVPYQRVLRQWRLEQSRPGMRTQHCRHLCFRIFFHYWVLSLHGDKNVILSSPIYRSFETVTYRLLMVCCYSCDIFYIPKWITSSRTVLYGQLFQYVILNKITLQILNYSPNRKWQWH